MPAAVTTAQDVSRLLAGLVPCDDLEAEHLAAVLAWLGSTEDVFRRAKPATPSPHLVSYVVPVDPVARQVLLVDHRLSGLWLPPGGHVEPGEHPWTCAVREGEEELGVRAEPLLADGAVRRPAPLFVTRTPTVEANPHVDVSLWYVVHGDADRDPDWDRREFAGVRWWPIDELAHAVDGFDPHTPRFIAKLETALRAR